MLKTKVKSEKQYLIKYNIIVKKAVLNKNIKSEKTLCKKVYIKFI